MDTKTTLTFFFFLAALSSVGGGRQTLGRGTEGFPLVYEAFFFSYCMYTTYLVSAAAASSYANASVGKR